MNILVPFDFTKTSEQAMKLALSLCGSQDRIECFHSIGPVYYPPEAPIYFDRTEELANAKKHLHNVVEPLVKSMPIMEKQWSCDVAEGSVVPTVLDKVDSSSADIMVMGTHDKESLLDKILGSNSNSIAALSAIPVILVHSSSNVDHAPRKILFAIDSKPNIGNALGVFRKLNNMWKAAVDFIHIGVNDIATNQQFEEVLNQCYLQEEVPYTITINSIKSDNAVKTLESMTYQNEYDMMVLVKNNSGLFSGYFRPSFSLKATHHVQLPVMILKEHD